MEKDISVAVWGECLFFL